jgi:BioD-like phosphotransacetylase family protein
MQKVCMSSLPLVLSPLDSYSIASRIISRKVKTLPGDTEKIARIQELVGSHVNIDRILERIDAPSLHPA